MVKLLFFTRTIVSVYIIIIIYITKTKFLIHIYKCFDENVTKIIVITGKGLRSKNILNPYLSKDLSILKYSVPEFIETNKILMKMIIEITDAKIDDGGGGAFYVYLKNKQKNEL